ncbi:unnamed protein product [Nippostrongylus brasiliensis]|uniref:PITH domain-containing protein n=1 Tax=Nippostrongylus brasiliensis TaxID=27835 RepID=A0A0N4Y678_NIPBR|nr:unnamed protein product [Nippostrongylus brasiliensis]
MLNIETSLSPDQAVALGVDDEALKLLRINFMKKLPAIELSYAFTGSFLPVVTYTMHLAAYSDAGNDPTKLHLHIVKSGKGDGEKGMCATFLPGTITEIAVVQLCNPNVS